VIIDGEPWFVAKDVCGVLGIKPNNVSNRVATLSPEMKGTSSVSTPGGVLNVLTVSESGVYRLVMRSDKPEAVAFQNWIASEVLPSIRRNGLYMTPKVAQEVIDDTEVFLAKALLIAKETIDKQKALLEEAKPKVALHSVSRMKEPPL
jgi:prophage antirepressor-like protein